MSRCPHTFRARTRPRLRRSARHRREASAAPARIATARHVGSDPSAALNSNGGGKEYRRGGREGKKKGRQEKRRKKRRKAKERRKGGRDPSFLRHVQAKNGQSWRVAAARRAEKLRRTADSLPPCLLASRPPSLPRLSPAFVPSLVLFPSVFFRTPSVPLKPCSGQHLPSLSAPLPRNAAAEATARTSPRPTAPAGPLPRTWAAVGRLPAGEARRGEAKRGALQAQPPAAPSSALRRCRRLGASLAPPPPPQRRSVRQDAERPLLDWGTAAKITGWLPSGLSTRSLTLPEPR